MGRGVGELQNAPELTCNVSCTLLCIHATAAFPLSSPLNLMLAIGDLSSALLLLLPSSAISATCLLDCQLLLDCCIVVAVSSSPPPSLTLLPTPVILSLPCSPSLSLSRSLSCYYCRWSQIALSLLFCGLKSLAGFLSMMDFGSSSLRETADRYHHSSEAIGKMEKRTQGSHNKSRCRSINTRKAKKGEEVMREEGKIVERKSLRRTPTATSSVQTATRKNRQRGGRIPGRTIFSLSGRAREIKPIDDAHHIRDCNNKQSEVWFLLLLLIASLENRSRNTLSEHHQECIRISCLGLGKLLSKAVVASSHPIGKSSSSSSSSSQSSSGGLAIVEDKWGKGGRKETLQEDIHILFILFLNGCCCCLKDISFAPFSSQEVDQGFVPLQA